MVIDPGHETTYNKWDTVDPGALGSTGKHEKDYTIDISSCLGSELEKTFGYKVVYTRQIDITKKQKRLAWRIDFRT